MIRLLFFLLTATSALACSVPVFRYALEHWEADAYRVTVYQQGHSALSEKLRSPLLKRRISTSSAAIKVEDRYQSLG